MILSRRTLDPEEPLGDEVAPRRGNPLNSRPFDRKGPASCGRHNSPNASARDERLLWVDLGGSIAVTRTAAIRRKPGIEDGQDEPLDGVVGGPTQFARPVMQTI